jgi:hypothetical protein
MEDAKYYQESLAELWKLLENAGLLAGRFPGCKVGGLEKVDAPISPEDFIQHAGNFLLNGAAIAVERSDGQSILIFGSEAMDKWPKSDPFFSWPFFPLMVDYESDLVGLVPGPDQTGFRLAWVSKICLYDESMPEDEDLAYISEYPVPKLPEIVGKLITSGEEMVFIGHF